LTNANLDCSLLGVAEMAAADALAASAGIRSLDLMEQAGRAVAGAILDRWPVGRAAVLCGPGNNGGDGYVIARLLADAGLDIRLGSLVERAALKGDAAINARRWSGNAEAVTPELIAGCDVIVDALFGAGLSRALDGAALEIVTAMNASGIPIAAVDMPSGVDGDNGQILGAAPTAQLTVTFFRKKPGHLLFPGRLHCGELLLADIGIPETVLQTIAPELAENLPVLWASRLPWPSHGDHKYTRGHLLICGGAEMTGAARLAARGARRMGAGMVSIAAPKVAVPVYQADDPGLVVCPITPDNRFGALLGQRRISAALVGPGNGSGLETRQNVIAALATKMPVVIDADGLSAFEGAPEDLFGWIKGPCVLTPHEGEFARLFPDLVRGRLQSARAAARRSGATIVLKGADTVIADPGGRALINANAPASLATAGSGDVLAGMIAALMAQGLEALYAAAAAVWLHGAAAQRFGTPAGLIAEDLPDQLPPLLAELANDPT
jgi:hydroxyethylthiazole kinase-like uncharacterized protein yjeF